MKTTRKSDFSCCLVLEFFHSLSLRGCLLNKKFVNGAGKKELNPRILHSVGRGNGWDRVRAPLGAFSEASFSNFFLDAGVARGWTIGSSVSGLHNCNSKDLDHAITNG